MWKRMLLVGMAMVLLMLPMAAVAQTGEGIEANDSVPYIYPVVPGTDAWQKLTTHDEMLRVTQIPADILGTLSTPALLDTVLAYPLYGDVLLHNSLQHGFDNVAGTFNGMQELLRRPDAAIATMAVYAGMDPLQAGASLMTDQLEQPGSHTFRFTYVEILMAQWSMLNQLSPEQRLDLLRLTWAKIQGKQGLVDIYGITGLQTSLLLAGRNLQISQTDTDTEASVLGAADIQTFLQDGSTANVTVLNTLLAETAKALGEESFSIQLEGAVPEDYSGFVYTPRGSRVAVTWVTQELTPQQIADYDNYAARVYPRAYRLRSATRKYNCHSYAWYSSSSRNNAWMNSPQDDKYWTDGSFYQLNYTPWNSANVSFKSDDHSAVLNGSGQIESKWGPSGLYRHDLCYCPYSCGRDFWGRPNVKYYRLARLGR